MDRYAVLTLFFDNASKDARIGISHIGLYVTLFQMLSEKGFDGPLIAFGAEVMQKAKISSTATYHKMIKELHAYGYICYTPSYYKGVGSTINIT